MEYRSKYKAEEIEAILDAKNNTGEGVDSNLDVLFTGQLQTKEVEVSEDTTIKADEGFLGLKEVSVKVSGGGSSYRFYSIEGVGDAKPAALEYLMPSFAKANGMIIPAALAYAANMWESVSAISVDASANIFMGGEWRNIGELLDGQSSFLQVCGFAEITEEEFYTL